MTDPRVIKATFSDWKPVKTRSALQIILEVPIEKTEEVMQMLGVPIPGQERWVAVALLDKSVPDVSACADTTQRQSGKRWADLSRAQQAGILCADERFWEWAGVTDQELAAEYVRHQCGVSSRRELDVHKSNGVMFDEMVLTYRRDTGQMAEER